MNQHNHHARFLFAAIVPLCIALLASAAWACQVPVFRYALERWSPDPYELLVLHDGELSVDEQSQVDMLRKLTGKSGSGVNLAVKSIRLDETERPSVRKLWTHDNPSGRPIIALLYPSTVQEVPDRLVTTLPLSKGAIEPLVDSPLRTEIAKRLLGGQSAVWIFVPIGDPKQDDLALAELEKEIMQNQADLELPQQDDAEGEDALLTDVDIELRLEFSVVTLQRDDPKEKFLLEMLLRSEADLADLQQPMAFPVLGRGRVLYALVGKGIAADNIGIASRFIIGPCSCQVKDQNPGFDLLMNCDWDGQVGTEKLSEAVPERRLHPLPITIPPGKSATGLKK